MSTLTEPTPGVAASVADAGADLIAPPVWASGQHRLARGILEHSKQMLALADGAAAALAILVAPALFAQNGPAPAVLAALVGGLAFIAAGAMVRLYQARYVDRPGEEIRRVAWAALLVGASVIVGAWALARPVERSWLGVVLAAIATAVSVERQGIRVLFAVGRRRRLLLRRVAIVGTNHEAWAVRQVLADDPATGYEVVAVIRPPQSGPPADRRKEIERVLHTIREAQASGVLIPAGAVDPDNANRLIRRLTDEGLHVEITSALRDVNVRRLRMRPVGPLSVTYVEAVALGGWRAAAKRGFDVIVAATALVVLSPVLLLAGLAVKATSRGPAFFRQTRLGREAQPFRVWKLRTMVYGAEAMVNDLEETNDADGPLFKMRHDPRVTPVGRFLRRTSIDEIPQLWNVLRNDMSLVGPRPALPHEAAQWNTDLHDRLRVKPGMTGMWQVHGRSNSSFDEYARLDLYYVHNWSLAVDLAILARTLPTVLRSKGAF